MNRFKSFEAKTNFYKHVFSKFDIVLVEVSLQFNVILKESVSNKELEVASEKCKGIKERKLGI